MIDSFPFDSWEDVKDAFWTFGPQNSTGTYILTVLGIILMVGSIIGWVWLENRKLTAQAALLRGAGGMPAPGGIPPGPGPSQPPMAGPSTHPGE
ncbi:MAG TPA: hypothetical protein VFW80_12905 [Gaiellaceae bacterium]|nr:hypothetical protein [Gaiellaceae bacterium]